MAVSRNQRNGEKKELGTRKNCFYPLTEKPFFANAFYKKLIINILKQQKNGATGFFQ
jgi:hypothetical protein